MAEKKKMKISELERTSGVPRSRIYYYIQQELLPPPEKTSQTMAYYGREHLERLEAIEGIKMEYLERSGKFRMPAVLLRDELDKRGKRGEGPGIARPEEEFLGYGAEGRRKADIVAAGMRLFTENGYYQTGLRDIAREVGISPSAIYFYFPGKRELFAAVIDGLIAEVNSEVEKVLATGTDAAQTYLSFFDVYRKNYYKLGQIASQLRAGVIIGDEWARERLVRIFEEMSRIIKATIRFSMEIGVLRKLDEELLCYYLISVTEAAFQGSITDDRYTPDEIFAFFFDAAYNGLAPLRTS